MTKKKRKLKKTYLRKKKEKFENFHHFIFKFQLNIIGQLNSTINIIIANDQLNSTINIIITNDQ
jgi:hypothetical protein